MIKTSTIVRAVALVAVALGGLLVANALAGGTPPGQDPCSHGATGKACRPDPQPDNGKDCLHHGQEGGVNEDHCLCAPGEVREGDHCITPPTTTATTPSSTVTVTTPGATTTTPGRTTVTTPGQTVTTTTTLPGITVTNSPTSTVVVQAPPAQPAVTSTVTNTVTRTVTTGAGVAPARTSARTKVRVVHHTRVVYRTRTHVVYRTRVRVVHEKCRPIRVCGAGLVGKPPRCGAAGKG